MKRRALLTAMAAAAALAAALPRIALAQRAGKLPVVGFVASTASPEEMRAPENYRPFQKAFLLGLRERGWEEGRNLLIERHTAEGKLERAQAIFADLVARKVDLIYTSGSIGIVQMPAEAVRATKTIPIVFVGGGADPVGSGLVSSLARPGGNVTGLTVNLGVEFSLKRLEILKEIAPRIKRVAFLGPGQDFHKNIDRIRASIDKLGLTMILAAVEKAEDYEAAFAGARRGAADAMLVSSVPLNLMHRAHIVALAAKHRLPAEYFFREAVEAGGLVAYGVDLLDLGKRSAGYVDRILRGAKPGDLPVEQPSKFLLAINLKTAKELGLAIPQSVLLRANEVVE